MLRTKGFSAIAGILAGVAARTNAMKSHRTTEKAWQEYVRGAATRMQPVPNGLIHDWIGVVFTVTIDGLMSVVHDYGRYEAGGIPRSVRWLVNPAVNHLSVASVSTTS